MLQPLDGPSAQLKLASVDTVTVVEVKAGASPLTERKAVTLQPLGGKIYIYFGDGVSTPNAATVIANGLVHEKTAKETYEAGEQQPMFILAVAGTTDVICVERA